MAKEFTRENFKYIKFDDVGELIDFIRCTQLMLYADSEDNLYCFNYTNTRSLKYDKDLAKWVKDDKHSIKDYEYCDRIMGDLAKDIFKAIPPFDAFYELEKDESVERLKFYNELRKKTPHKVVGWLEFEEVEDKYQPCEDEEQLYFAAIINDIVERKYFFIASWMPLVPIFEDGTYGTYGDRSMGDAIALSKGESSDYAYVDYAFGEEYFFADDSIFNIPKKGMYND